jgi:beta-lactamase regulating signal transducer with metallopeptidase domain
MTLEALDAASRLVWSSVLFLSIQGGLAGVAALVLVRALRRFSPAERSAILLLGLVAFVVPFRVLLPGVAAARSIDLAHPSIAGFDVVTLSLSMLYMVGAAVGLAALARQRLDLSRILRTARLSSTNGDASVLVSEEVAVPFAARPLAPVVILPTALVRRMAPERIEHVVRHELAHIRHGDLWINLLAAIVRALFWFHPVARLLVRELAAVREELCDDAVIRAGCNPASYGSTLVRAAEFVSSSGASCRVAFTGREFDRLASRLRRLGTVDVPGSRMRRRVTAICCCASVAIGVMLAAPDLRIGRSGPADHRESHRASHLAHHHG